MNPRRRPWPLDRRLLGRIRKEVPLWLSWLPEASPAFPLLESQDSVFIALIAVTV